MRYSIRLSYNGSAFNGWQIQPNATSIQEHLQIALARILHTDITVIGAGRTDSKVNAVNYTAHFDIPDNLHKNTSNLSISKPDTADFLYKINAITPREIVIHEIKKTDEDFHARFSAIEREYKYFLHKKKDPFIKSFSYYCCYNLNIEAMNEAAKKLIGEHNFSCFEKTGGNNITSICKITYAKWESYTPWHSELLGFQTENVSTDYLVFTIKADRFLRNMVRAIVGTLIDIGRGKHNPEWIEELMESKNRCNAGESVEGHALFLSNVKYEILNII